MPAHSSQASLPFAIVANGFRAYQSLLPPTLNAGALAQAIVKELRDGAEDVFSADVAQEWLEGWRENPKAFKRELSAR